MPPVEVITGLGEAEYVGDLTAGDQSGGVPEGFSCGEARYLVITPYGVAGRLRASRAARCVLYLLRSTHYGMLTMAIRYACYGYTYYGFSCGEAPGPSPYPSPNPNLNPKPKLDQAPDQARPAVPLSDLLPARPRPDRSAVADRGTTRAEASPQHPSPADSAEAKARAILTILTLLAVLLAILTADRRPSREEYLRGPNPITNPNLCPNQGACLRGVQARAGARAVYSIDGAQGRPEGEARAGARPDSDPNPSPEPKPTPNPNPNPNPNLTPNLKPNPTPDPHPYP